LFGRAQYARSGVAHWKHSKGTLHESPKVFSSRWRRWSGSDGFAWSNDFDAWGFIDYT
jgi:hypothetical protein